MRYGEVELKSVESKDILGTAVDGEIKKGVPDAGNAYKFLRVNAAGTAFEYSEPTYA